jgi:hypothetical protein
MDAIRLRQINEALGYDRSMNAMVFNIEKKRVARYPDEEVIPESQITEEMEDTAKEQVNALRVILDNKHANVAVLIRPGVQLESNPFSYAAREIIQVEAVVQSYNTAVAPYASSKNQMFKQSILNKLLELLSPIGSIRGGLLKLVTSITRKMSATDNPLRPTLNFYFVRFIEALAVYDLMYEYIKSAKLLRITSEDAKARAQDLINQKAACRSIAAHDDVRSLFRDFDCQIHRGARHR